nr:hypothetical protein [Xenorhabdus sp. 3]
MSDEIFLIPAEQHKKIQGKECFITNKFEKYVEKYIKAVKTSDKHVLNSLEYRFTTLQNYHNQLGI